MIKHNQQEKYNAHHVGKHSKLDVGNHISCASFELAISMSKMGVVVKNTNHAASSNIDESAQYFKTLYRELCSVSSSILYNLMQLFT